MNWVETLLSSLGTTTLSKDSWLYSSLPSSLTSRQRELIRVPAGLFITYIQTFLLTSIYKYTRPGWEWCTDYNFDIMPSLPRWSPIGFSHHSFYIILSLLQGLVIICVSTMEDQCGSDVLTKHSERSCGKMLLTKHNEKWCCWLSTMENSVGVMLLSHCILMSLWETDMGVMLLSHQKTYLYLDWFNKL